MPYLRSVSGQNGPESHIKPRGRSPLLDPGEQRGEHPLLLATGDLNILHGYGDYGNAYWAARYATVFSRMSALGLPFVGPQAPVGRRADPWPDELPRTSNNVTTYHTKRQTPVTAYDNWTSCSHLLG